MRPLLLGLGLSVIASACARDQRSHSIEEASIVLTQPTRLSLVTTSTPVVEARVGSDESVRMLLDTGASHTLFGTEAVRRLGLVERPFAARAAVQTSDSRSVAFDSYVQVERLVLGDLELADVRVLVIDSEAHSALGIDGILGQDLLSRLVLVFDPQRGEVHLLPPGAGPDGIESFLARQDVGFGAWGRVPFALRPTPFLELALPAGTTLDIALDTGATSTSLPTSVVEALGLERVSSTEARSLAGITQPRTFRLAGLNLFGLQIGAEVQENELDHGLLGMDILSHLVIVIDGPRRELWLHHRTIRTEGHEPAQPEPR
jgi:predicted aspartyl protease